MYFAITYEIWPKLTGREALSLRLQRRQLWLWFLGMMVMSLPWHWLGLQGQWRRVAQFDYSNPIIAAWGPWVVVSLVGGLLLLASALLFIWNLVSVRSSFRSHPASMVAPYRFALAVHPPARVPAALNGFGLWNALVLFLMLSAYGWPIAEAFVINAPHAVVHRVDRGG
jgi:cytochrome c oxidase subunit 1